MFYRLQKCTPFLSDFLWNTEKYCKKIRKINVAFNNFCCKNEKKKNIDIQFVDCIITLFEYLEAIDFDKLKVIGLAYYEKYTGQRYHCRVEFDLFTVHFVEAVIRRL